MVHARRLTIQFIVSCIGIILIGALPQLFTTSGGYIDLVSYVNGVKGIWNGLLHADQITYNVQGTLRPIFPIIFDPFFYSFTILLASLVLGVVVAALLTHFTMLLPKRALEKVKFIIFILESLPDLLVIISMQLFVIFVYKQTGHLLFNIASLPEEKAYVLPIITLSILPTIQLYKLMILVFEEELEKQYVELAKGKGLRQGFILLVHVLRNAAISIFYHSKSILWFMLSNLLVLEYLFNIFGITSFMMSYLTPEIFTIGLFLFFVPLFFIYAIGEMLVLRIDKGEGSRV